MQYDDQPRKSRSYYPLGTHESFVKLHRISHHSADTKPKNHRNYRINKPDFSDFELPNTVLVGSMSEPKRVRIVFIS